MTRERFDRSKYRESVKRETDESYEKRELGDSYKYFKTDIDIPLLKLGPTKDDPHSIDIIPFVVGDNYPMCPVKKKFLKKKGDIAYYLDVFVHKQVGLNKEEFVCLARSYGKKCPICEEFQRRNDNDEPYDDIKHLIPSRRNVYNVVCFDSEKETEKGIQVYEVSHYYMEKELQIRAKRKNVYYADPDIGKRVVFDIKNDTMKTIEGHDFEDRDYKISDAALQDAFCLDELVYPATYAEIYESYFGEPFEESSSLPDRGGSGSRYTQREEIKDETKKEEDIPQSVENKCSQGYVKGADFDTVEACKKECKDDEYFACKDAKEQLDKEEKDREEAKQSTRRRR